MSSFLSTYFAWAAPNVLPAMAVAAAAMVLAGLLRGHGLTQKTAIGVIIPIGLAVVAVVGLSAVFALLGIQPGSSSAFFGLIAGIVTSLPFLAKA